MSRFDVYLIHQRPGSAAIEPGKLLSHRLPRCRENGDRLERGPLKLWSHWGARASFPASAAQLPQPPATTTAQPSLPAPRDCLPTITFFISLSARRRRNISRRSSLVNILPQTAQFLRRSLSKLEGSWNTSFKTIARFNPEL